MSSVRQGLTRAFLDQIGQSRSCPHMLVAVLGIAVKQVECGKLGLDLGGGSKIENFIKQKKKQINSVGWPHTRVDNNKKNKPRPVAS